MHTNLAQHTIWKNIRDLLYQHDCVIVPNFGGFVCNREHTRIDQVSHVIVPPGRRVMFNQNLRTNDGLLAQNIAQSLRISYSEALLAIEQVVTDIRNHLEQAKQLDIDTFGSFRLNAEANYVFLPEKQNTYLHSSFGLTPLQAIPVSELHKGARKTKIFRERKEVRKARNLGRAKNAGLKMLTAALVVMLALNGYIFLTDHNLIGGAKISTTGINSWFDSLFASGHQIEDQTSSTNIPEVTPEKETPIVTLPEPAAEVTSDDTLTLIAEDPAVETEPVFDATHFAKVFSASNKEIPVYSTLMTEEIPAEQPLTEETVSAPVAPAIRHSEGHIYSYHVIGGVFCKEKNARQFFNKLKERGFEAELLLNTRINCNRVSYRKLYSLEEAIQLMDSLKLTENPEAWVLTIREKQ